MTCRRRLPRPLARALARSICRYCFDRRGNIASIFALLLVPLVGVLGLAGETTSWFMVGRAAQNAADGAALAAAANGDTTKDAGTCASNVRWCAEAKSVAANSGFSGANTSVTVINNDSVSCPGGANNCYKVTVQRSVPLILTGALGYSGTSGYGGRQLIQAVSYASPFNAGTNFCMLSLDAAGTGITQNNGTMTLNGCGVQANSSSSGAINQTNGTFTAASIDAVGTVTCHTSTSCSPAPSNGQKALTDPYSGIYTANSVSSLVNQPCPAANKNISVNSGTKSISNGVYCGSLTVNTNGTLAMGAGTYIMQGVNFTTNGTITGTGVTIILTCATQPCTGSSSGWATFTQNGGTVGTTTTPFSAPTTGSWSGILFYQDPTEKVSGSSGTTAFKMTSGANTLEGALYFPTTNVTWTNGGTASPCLHIIAYTMTLTSGSVNSSCAGVGVANIGQSPTRAALVQ